MDEICKTCDYIEKDAHGAYYCNNPWGEYCGKEKNLEDTCFDWEPCFACLHFAAACNPEINDKNLVTRKRKNE